MADASSFGQVAFGLARQAHQARSLAGRRDPAPPGLRPPRPPGTREILPTSPLLAPVGADRAEKLADHQTPAAGAWGAGAGASGGAPAAGDEGAGC
jgi:hypothetical protein